MSFFIRGVTKANFKESENSAQDKDKLQIVVSTGASSSIQFFSNQVGIGSNTHDFEGDLEIILQTSSQRD